MAGFGGLACFDGPVGALMTHLTQPRFVYAHEWRAGDLVVWDNRRTLHAATCSSPSAGADDGGRQTRRGPCWRGGKLAGGVRPAKSKR
ncbi:TauD/TfdA dioxygenase family protein [Belnapia moabensis]|uniref:TauD/TfdA dioxygenase family protein n=1 Tax=Belnapia moabensis TaxID=365533 RepID=UPI000A048154